MDYNSSFKNKVINPDHQVYDNLNNTWIKKSSQPQPYVNVSVETKVEDCKSLGYASNFPSKPREITVSAMTDTSCQSCLAGIKIAHRFGLNERNLILVTLKMHAANNRNIKILGATILRFSGTNSAGEMFVTRQVVYIIDSSNKLFLSREACTALGIITDNFPTIGDTKSDEGLSTNTVDSSKVHDISCDCPRRKLPPQMPTQFPFPATEEHRADIQQYLLDRYKSSTFNTCEHQPLLLMTGPPMKLMVDTNATPVAHHTPVPVPLHWQDKVKSGLDQDVRLGFHRTGTNRRTS